MSNNPYEVLNGSIIKLAEAKCPVLSDQICFQKKMLPLYIYIYIYIYYIVSYDTIIKCNFLKTNSFLFLY